MNKNLSLNKLKTIIKTFNFEKIWKNDDKSFGTIS